MRRFWGTAMVFAVMLTWTLQVQAQRMQQKLGRGVVAVKRGGTSRTTDGGSGALVSWRKLAQESEGTTYNLYQRAQGATGYSKVNTQPISKTNYATTLQPGTEYAVTAITDGVEGEMSAPFLYKTRKWDNVWFDFDFDNSVIKRNDYRTKFVWPMDTDGDGEVDAMLVDRIYAGAVEIDADAGGVNAGEMTATTDKLQAYRLDGTLLWTIDMGPNCPICGGSNDKVVAYDINCDGRCEVIIKSSDGTRFWDSGSNTFGRYAKGSSTADTDGDGIVDYRAQGKRNPPYYVSVVNAATGEEIDCSELRYDLVRTPGGQGYADQYSRDNRADYKDDNYGTEYAFLTGKFCICYFDGVHPSLGIEAYNRQTNGTHYYYVFAWGYDWQQGKPSKWHNYYVWSRNDKRPWPAEAHMLRVGDTDGDGIDELLDGGFGVNPTKGMTFSAGVGHGDRYIYSDIDPDRPGMECFFIQQTSLLGQVLYDAATGEHLKEWYLPSLYDVGRGACMDIDPAHKGYEMYSFADDFIYDCKGEKTGKTRSGYGISTTFEGFWWDGNLLREELSSPGGSGYGTNLMVTTVLGKSRLIEFSRESDWGAMGATGTRPAFMGDIIGDWREEVILAKQNADSSTGLVGYSTNLPTNHSIYCLQQDPHYRGDCTTRGYYQHPNTSFYLGEGMPTPPLPPVMLTALRWKGGQWQNGFTSFDQTAALPYADGKSLIFDISGDNSTPVAIDSPVAPGAVYLMSPKGHDYVFEGKGGFTGEMSLTKSMLGTVTFNQDLTYSGKTIISEGTLKVNGKISGPVELRAKGTLAGNATVAGGIHFESALNYEGCRLLPEGADGCITFEGNLTLPGDVYIEVVCAEGRCGHIKVNGDLTLTSRNTITCAGENLTAGRYMIAECTGTLTADPELLSMRGLEGINYDIVSENNRLWIVIHETRTPAEEILWTGAENGTWDYKTQNFSLKETPTAFVTDDQVVFDAGASNTNVVVNDKIQPESITVNGGQYTFSGNGAIIGNGSLTVNPGATVNMRIKYNEFTGPVNINKGTLSVVNFYDGGQRSAIGASGAEEGNLNLNGGTLALTQDNMATDHIINVTDTAVIRVIQPSSALSLKGQVKGSGYLVKEGLGQLNFNYGGANTFTGIIVKQGVVAQGAWNATFGKSGGPMVLAGGRVNLLDVNNSSTRPIFNHVTTVVEGTSSTVQGTTRGAINGSFRGKGNLTIISSGVRNDIGANFSLFEGQLTAEGGNFRLMDNVTDMQKTRLVMAAGNYIGHYASNGSGLRAVTTKIGSLASPANATTATLGHTQDSYEIGYLGESTSFYGKLAASRITKVGEGTLTLCTAGSTSPVSINGGTLELNNTGTAQVVSGLITVRQGGTLTGNGACGNVTVQKGGTLAAGVGGKTGVLRVKGNVSLLQGATTRIKADLSGNDAIDVSGTVTHNQDTLEIVVAEGRRLEVGDELTLFTGFSKASGDVIVKCDGYLFDTSTLNTDGRIRVAGTSGIRMIASDDERVDIYTTAGILIRRQQPYGRALKTLRPGVYIIKGRKVVVE